MAGELPGLRDPLTHDYGSRYAVGIHGDDAKPNGLVTALMTERMFEETGASPTVLQARSRLNFMSEEMQATLLDRALHIPLVSPAHYAPYNGGVERTHQDIIRSWRLLEGEKADGLTLRLACQRLSPEVNHLHKKKL